MDPTPPRKTPAIHSATICAPAKGGRTPHEPREGSPSHPSLGSPALLSFGSSRRSSAADKLLMGDCAVCF